MGLFSQRIYPGSLPFHMIIWAQEEMQALVFLISCECGFKVLVVTLVSSKTLNQYCCVLRMGREAVDPVCCVMHVKEPSALIVKRRGSPPLFLV